MMEKSRSTEEDALGIEAKPIQTPAKNSNDRSGTAVKGLADSSKKAKAVDSPSTCTLIISRNKYNVFLTCVPDFSRNAHI